MCGRHQPENGADSRETVCAYEAEHEENDDCGGIHTWVYADDE